MQPTVSIRDNIQPTVRSKDNQQPSVSMRENVHPSISSRELLMQQRKSGSIERKESTSHRMDAGRNGHPVGKSTGTTPLTSSSNISELVGGDDGDGDDGDGGDDDEIEDVMNVVEEETEDDSMEVEEVGEDEDEDEEEEEEDEEEDEVEEEDEEEDEVEEEEEDVEGGVNEVEEEVEDILGDSLTPTPHTQHRPSPPHVSNQNTQHKHSDLSLKNDNNNEENSYMQNVKKNIIKMSEQSLKNTTPSRRNMTNSPPQSRLKRLIMENDRDNFNLLEDTVEISPNNDLGRNNSDSENIPIHSKNSYSNNVTNLPTVERQNDSKDNKLSKNVPQNVWKNVLKNGNDATQNSKNKYQSNLVLPIRKDRGQVMTGDLGPIDSMLDTQNNVLQQKKEDDEKLQLQLELHYDQSRRIKQNYPPSIHDLIAMSPSIQDCVEVINTHEGHSRRTYVQNKVGDNEKNVIEKIWLENLPDRNKNKNENRNENVKEKEEEKEKEKEKENKGILDRDKMRMKGCRQEREQMQDMNNTEDNHLINYRIQQPNKQITQAVEIKNKSNVQEHYPIVEKKVNKVRDETDEENALLAEISELEKRQQNSYKGMLKKSDLSSNPTPSIPKNKSKDKNRDKNIRKNKLKALDVCVQSVAEGEDEAPVNVNMQANLNTEVGVDAQGGMQDDRKKSIRNSISKRSGSITRPVRSEGEVKDSRAFGPGARDSRKISISSPGKHGINVMVRSRSNSVVRATPLPSPTVSAAAAALTVSSTETETGVGTGARTGGRTGTGTEAGTETGARTGGRTRTGTGTGKGGRTGAGTGTGVGIGGTASVTDKEVPCNSLSKHHRPAPQLQQPSSSSWTNKEKNTHNDVEMIIEKKVLTNGSVTNHSVPPSSSSSSPSHRNKQFELKGIAKDKEEKVEVKERERGRECISLYNAGGEGSGGVGSMVGLGGIGGSGGGGGGMGGGGGGGYLMEYRKKLGDRTRDNLLSRRHSDLNPSREILKDDNTDNGNISLPSILFKSRQIFDTTQIFSENKNIRTGGAVSAPSRLRERSASYLNNDNDNTFECENINLHQSENSYENENGKGMWKGNGDRNGRKYQTANSLFLPAPVRLSHDYGSENLLKSLPLHSKAENQIRN